MPRSERQAIFLQSVNSLGQTIPNLPRRFCKAVLVALHDARSQQAARLIRQYRHLSEEPRGSVDVVAMARE